MRRAAFLLAASLGAAGLLALLVGATSGPPRHRHSVPIEATTTPAIVPTGDSTLTIECPAGYRLLNVSVSGGGGDVTVAGVVLTDDGRGAVVTLRNSAGETAIATLRGICVKARTGDARDQGGREHSHPLGDPDLETATVEVDPFAGAAVSVPCPTGSVATGGVAEVPTGVEVQGSYPVLDATQAEWRFQLFNTDRTQAANVTLKAICLPLWTERFRRDRHRHLLILVTPRIVGSVDESPRLARRPLATETTFSVECPDGYRAAGGGWSIPEGLFRILSESAGEGSYELAVEAASELPTVELTALCLAQRTAKGG